MVGWKNKTYSYSCSAGTLSGTNCVQSTSYTASCPSGYSYYNSTTCRESQAANQGSCKTYKSCANSSCSCKTYKSCANSACGAATYKSCADSACGCSVYKSCATSSCGCKTYKSCANSSCGYASCKASACGCAGCLSSLWKANCTKCGYSANSNHAVSVLNSVETDGKFAKAEIIDTPNTHTIEELAEFLKVPATVICKSLIYVVDGKYVVALIRGDRTVEETKLMNVFAGNEIRIARNDEIEEIMNESGFNAVAGFIGPKGLKNVEIVADSETFTSALFAPASLRSLPETHQSNVLLRVFMVSFFSRENLNDLPFFFFWAMSSAFTTR